MFPLITFFFGVRVLTLFSHFAAQGTGNFLWVPLANKYGRRPVYVISYAGYLAAALWLIFERHFAGFLLGRILLGFGAGAAETLAPITIAVRSLQAPIV